MQIQRGEVSGWNKQRENKQRERRSWGEKTGKERQRMREGDGKKTTTQKKKKKTTTHSEN